MFKIKYLVENINKIVENKWIKKNKILLWKNNEIIGWLNIWCFLYKIYVCRYCYIKDISF